MRHPVSETFQRELMGKRCSFTGRLWRDVDNWDEAKDLPKPNPKVTWRTTKFTAKSGWITGVGICFNGRIVNQGKNWNTLVHKKGVKYIKVKCNPKGKELKVPSRLCKLLTEG